MLTAQSEVMVKVLTRLKVLEKTSKEPTTVRSYSDSGSGLLEYGKIELMGRIRNSPFSMEFLIGCISDEGILGMAFLAG